MPANFRWFWKCRTGVMGLNVRGKLRFAVILCMRICQIASYYCQCESNISIQWQINKTWKFNATLVIFHSSTTWSWTDGMTDMYIGFACFEFKKHNLISSFSMNSNRLNVGLPSLFAFMNVVCSGISKPLCCSHYLNKSALSAESFWLGSLSSMPCSMPTARNPAASASSSSWTSFGSSIPCCTFRSWWSCECTNTWNLAAHQSPERFQLLCWSYKWKNVPPSSSFGVHECASLMSLAGGTTGVASNNGVRKLLGLWIQMLQCLEDLSPRSFLSFANFSSSTAMSKNVLFGISSIKFCSGFNCRGMILIFMEFPPGCMLIFTPLLCARGRAS